MAAGPSGINPQQQLTSQLSAAELFANVNVSKKEATGGKPAEPEKPLLDVEDKPELSTLAKSSQGEETLDIVESSLLSQQQSRQAQQEGFQTGIVGAHGKKAIRQEDETSEEQTSARPPVHEETAQPESEQTRGGKGSSHKSSGAKGAWEHAGGHRSISDDDAQTNLADLSGDAAADEKSLQKAKLRGKGQGNASGTSSELEETFGAEKEFEGALVASASGAPAVNHIESLVESNVESQMIPATYLYGTQPAKYTPPVHAESVQDIFSGKNSNAAQALPQVRGLELSPLPAHVEPMLEPQGKLTPLVMFEDGGIHGGDVEFGTGAQVA